MNPDAMTSYQDLLPPDGLPVCGFRLLSYINSKGQICYQFSRAGDVAISQLLGILEMVKFDLTKLAVESAHNQGNDE